jgi:SAM-dependent methyltransferase
MDELAQFNRERWNDLVAARTVYGQAWLDWDAAKAQQWLKENYVSADMAGKDVLCLANGGGQQSAAFGLLGANVTVIDMSDAQLEQDRIAAEHYGLNTRIEQGDMRDLSRFADDSFDVVWHDYSINFVPDAKTVLQEVNRVIRPGGLYYFHYSNPYLKGMDETDWNGEGYLLKRPYIDGAEVIFEDSHWYVGEQQIKVEGPREFNHSLSTIVNTLAGHGFVIRGLWEDSVGDTPDLDAEPGSWEHFIAIAPPYMILVATYQPGVLGESNWVIG